VNRFILTAVCLSALAVAACDKPATTETKTEDKSSTTVTAGSATGATTTTTTTTTTPTAAVTIEDSDLSTPADFEETAEKAITPKNYKAELATLETEINKE
jgi:hypothetical protein